MAVRRHFDPKAGPWVAFKHSPKSDRPHEQRKAYPWSDDAPWQAYTSDPKDALRFDTKAEALAFIRNWNPRRAGVVTGAERVDR